MYKTENFAQVLDTQHFENPESLKKRKAYVKHQISVGFFNDLTRYQKENPFNNWSDLIVQCEKVIGLGQEIYKKNLNNGQVIFLLEQVLGRVEFIFDERENITLKLNPQYYHDYKDNLLQLELLSKQLAVHQSILMNNLGISLMAIGVIIVLTALLTSVFMLGGVIAGTAMTVTGLIFSVGTLFSSYGQQQNDLSLAVSTLANTADNTKINERESPIDYFDNFISPRIYPEDAIELRKNLVLQLNEGFDPIILKNALRWAIRADYISNGKYEDFFQCMADICCKSSNYWISNKRIGNHYWPGCSGQMFKQSSIPINTKNNFFSKSTCSAISTLKLFDEITTGQIKSEYKMMMREGLHHLINNNFPPFLIKHAFVWAKTRSDEDQSPLSTSSFTKKKSFFDRIATICGVALAPKVLADPLFYSEKPQRLESLPVRELPVFGF